MGEHEGSSQPANAEGAVEKIDILVALKPRLASLGVEVGPFDNFPSSESSLATIKNYEMINWRPIESPRTIRFAIRSDPGPHPHANILERSESEIASARLRFRCHSHRLVPSHHSHPPSKIHNKSEKKPYTHIRH